MSFKSLGLSVPILEAIAYNRFEAPTPIQKEAIPAVLSGRDILGIAKTGSGKTAAYVWPTMMKLAKNKKHVNRHIEALVLVPTRELAMQVQEVFSLFNSESRIPSMAVYGGASINPQMMKMNRVKFLVATPGRLLELHRANAVQFENLQVLVLDEADKMLQLGFKEEMDEIFKLLPKKRQNLLFSATLTEEVKNIENLLLDNPLTVSIEEKEAGIELINQTAYFTTAEKKGPLLRRLIKEKEMKQVLVFCSSVYQCDLVSDKLVKNGINSKAIHSKKSLGNRKESLISFKQGKTTVLVATDLLARGIDIEELPYVINYELPRSPKDFVHRIGRTGRAENKGEAITLFTEEEEHHFKVIQKKMKRWVDIVDERESE
jgi:ATP-dependent RNA helicase RhlE